MRTFTISTFVFLAFVVNVPTVHAACVQDETEGFYYDNVTYAGCTPQTGGVKQTSNNIPTQTLETGNNIPTAQTGESTTLINPLQGGGSLESFLLSILSFVIRIGTIIVILMLVYVGYLFVAAQGKEEKIREARSALLWTVVGALVLLGSQAIAIAIKATVEALRVG